MKYRKRKERLTPSMACFIISAVASLLTLLLQMGLYFVAPGGFLLELESLIIRSLPSYWLIMAILVLAITLTWAVGFCFQMHTWWVLGRIKRTEMAGALLTPVVVVAGAMLFSLLARFISPLSL